MAEPVTTYRLKTVLDGLATELDKLVGPGKTLRAFGREIPNLMASPVRPCLGMVLSGLRRQDEIWDCQLKLWLLVDTGADVDAAIIAAVAEVDTAIATYAAGGSAGGCIDQPTWEIAVLPLANGQFQKCGAEGTLRARVADPLKTTS
ncbi:MAG: hypothetical protein WC789_13780 [Lentisphaeria bacterium]